MQSIRRNGLIAVALMASALAFAAQPVSAHRYVIEEPVVIDRAYGDGPYYAPGYVRVERPFSLHRFVGNAVGAPIGVSKDILFPHHYYWY